MANGGMGLITYSYPGYRGSREGNYGLENKPESEKFNFYHG